MGVKPVIRLRDELFIEALLASAGLIACHKEDGLAPGVKGEGNAPLTIRGTEAELFHIGVAGIVQRIGARAPQQRSRPSRIVVQMRDRRPECGVSC